MLDLAEASTGIFRDTKDFQIPKELDPDFIYKNIKLALEKKGYRGPVLIRMYGDKNTLPPNELIEKYERAGIRISFVPEGIEYACARDNRMLLDILLWVMENRERSNLMVLSKNVKEEMTVSYIECMHLRGCNIFLADQPSESEFPTESPAWLLESLSDVFWYSKL